MVKLVSTFLIFCTTLSFAQDLRLIISAQVSPSRTRHLLVEIKGNPETQVDKITIKLPKTVIGEKVVEGTIPEGWRLKARPSKLTLSGPALKLPFRARLEMGRQDAPLQVKATVHNGRERLYSRENQLLRILPPLQVADKLRGLLALPPLMCAGDFVEMRIFNPMATPPDGTWTIAGIPLKAEPDPLLKDANGNPGWILKMKVPDNFTSNQPLAVSYHDPLGLRTVHVTKDLKSVHGTLPKDKGNQPQVMKCAPRGVVGGGLCVSGWFPTEASRQGLLLDGKPAPPPITVSNQAIFVPLLPDIEPGIHRITGDPNAGFAPGEPIEFEVIDVQAELDREELVEGQMAELGFFVVGSDAAMKIRVINTTPEIIAIDGGDEQVIETFGGGGNIATKTIETKALGNFVIKYEMAEPRCPCLNP